MMLGGIKKVTIMSTDTTKSIISSVSQSVSPAIRILFAPKFVASTITTRAKYVRPTLESISNHFKSHAGKATARRVYPTFFTCVHAVSNLFTEVDFHTIWTNQCFEVKAPLLQVDTSYTFSEVFI
jgi:hypothetical protein